MADGKLTLSVTNPDSGSAQEELDVDYDSTPMDIGFNARYLLDITEQLDSDTALFKASGSGLANPGAGPRRSERALCADAHAGVNSRQQQ